jgi:hypothetical protein
VKFHLSFLCSCRKGEQKGQVRFDVAIVGWVLASAKQEKNALYPLYLLFDSASSIQ